MKTVLGVDGHGIGGIGADTGIGGGGSVGDGDNDDTDDDNMDDDVVGARHGMAYMSGDI